jgi:hypothetical protein
MMSMFLSAAAMFLTARTSQQPAEQRLISQTPHVRQYTDIESRVSVY